MKNNSIASNQGKKKRKWQDKESNSEMVDLNSNISVIPSAANSYVFQIKQRFSDWFKTPPLYTAYMRHILNRNSRKTESTRTEKDNHTNNANIIIKKTVLYLLIPDKIKFKVNSFIKKGKGTS